MPDFKDKKQAQQLSDLHKVEEEELVAFLAENKYGIPYINLRAVVIDNEALRAVPEDKARAIEVAPFKLQGKKLSIAVRAPARPEMENLKKTLIEHEYEPTFYMASLASLEKVWQRYEELSHSEQLKAGSIDIQGATLLDLGREIKTIKDVERVADKLEEENPQHKISKMLEIILAGAVALEASDVHVEPENDGVRLRYRIDGILQDVMNFEERMLRMLNSRIKILSGLKLTETKNAQDGRFSIFLEKREINIRTSTVPGAYGEGIVMRLLDPKNIQVGMESLGMNKTLYNIVLEEIQKPNGMLLLTGPTGSGKTTSLYSFLLKIYKPSMKIITIENPIEYHLDGITQTQVNHKEEYTFESGLRAVLRQDPDVIMLGEIRDGETAKTAVQAALTGHMVFSTLHTNNAEGVLPRLLDLGVNPKTVTSALSLSIAQRLVRKLCEYCKKEDTPNEKEEGLIRTILENAKKEGKDLSIYEVDISSLKDIVIFRPGTCEKCRGLGYKGRLGIFEAIRNDAEIEKIATENPSERQIKKIAEKQGIPDMKEDGIMKVLEGITSIEEVMRATDVTEN